MRIDQEAMTAHLRLLEKFRPCPDCGSDRVTVRQDAASGQTIQGRVLRVQCSDCSFAREFPEP